MYSKKVVIPYKELPFDEVVNVDGGALNPHLSTQMHPRKSMNYVQVQIKGVYTTAFRPRMWNGRSLAFVQPYQSIDADLAHGIVSKHTHLVVYVIHVLVRWHDTTMQPQHDSCVHVLSFECNAWLDEKHLSHLLSTLHEKKLPWRGGCTPSSVHVRCYVSLRKGSEV